MKPHILVLNKMDLVDMRFRKLVEKKLENDGANKVVFTKCNENEASESVYSVRKKLVTCNFFTTHKY